MRVKELWESMFEKEHAEVNGAFDRGCKYDVVQALRDRKGWGLKDAKDVTDYAMKIRDKV